MHMSKSRKLTGLPRVNSGGTKVGCHYYTAHMSVGRNLSNAWGGDIRVVKSPHTCVVREDFLLRGHDEAGRILRLVTVEVVNGEVKYCW